MKIRFGKITTKTTVALLFCLVSGIAYAGAWTQKSGKGLFINNFSYYSTNKYFDNSGKKQSIADYQKYEMNPYIEYGLRDDITIGANLFLQHAIQQGNNTGIGDSELFARYRLWQGNGAVFSVEPMLKLPSLGSEFSQPKIGSKNFDAGLTFSGGYGFKAWELDHFINLDVGYRHRFGTPDDQLKFTTTAGFSLSQKTILLTQVFTTTRFASHDNHLFTQSSGDDYNLNKLQISSIYKLDDKISLQVGAFTNISGRNVGNGSGVNFAIYKVF